MRAGRSVLVSPFPWRPVVRLSGPLCLPRLPLGQARVCVVLIVLASVVGLLFQGVLTPSGVGLALDLVVLAEVTHRVLGWAADPVPVG
ncbi:hypothetical protein [Actinokineospora enzanensis]|uniref:hypothetical protein n=1 Tax=Actinokineospora enzanensis TaxID=155975 RepID=UPI000375A9E8|nr:hypothetical protein [Actinokineospora enzanensis]